MLFLYQLDEYIRYLITGATLLNLFICYATRVIPHTPKQANIR